MTDQQKAEEAWKKHRLNWSEEHLRCMHLICMEEFKSALQKEIEERLLILDPRRRNPYTFELPDAEDYIRINELELIIELLHTTLPPKE